MVERQLWRHFDWTLLLIVLALSLIGIAMVYSATRFTEELADYWQRQTLFLILGLVALFAIAVFDYRHLEILAPLLFVVFIVSLVSVTLFGESQGTGSRRWIEVGGTFVQPTEAGKFLLVVSMAWYLSHFRDRLPHLLHLVGAVVLLTTPLIFVFQQPDLGMTVTMGVIGGVLIFTSGIQYWQLGLIGGGLGLALPFVPLEGYMKERIAVFLNPEANEAAAFNINQALIAIGSGGWFGRGWSSGSQNQLFFLRVRHTDFIFSVISEELGLLGAVLILAMLSFVVLRLLRIADNAQDHFGRLLATGVATIVFFQVVVNVGMNLSLVPVTGLTLPFISYGGSSLMSMLFAIGLAQSVAIRHRKIEFL